MLSPRHSVPLSEPCIRAECCNLAMWKGASDCPTAIMRMCMPCRWSWHSLSVLTRPIPQGCAMPCWKGCACEKTDKCFGFCWATALRVNVSECGCVSIRPCIHTILLARRSAVLLLRAFSFRLWMAGIARSAAFSCLSVSFAPFCIVLRIKVLAVLP